MTESVNFAEVVSAWAASEPSVKGLVLIGSRAREIDDDVWRADAHSDWDFHVISSQPQVFSNPTWTHGLTGMSLRAYVARSAHIGGVPKVNAIFRQTAADFVVLPAGRFRILRLLAALGVHHRSATVRRRLQELAVVVRPGWKFLKGAKVWEPLYRRSVQEVSDPRISDLDVCRLADGFVCDYVSISRKIARGELIAAQRLMHHDLAETNFRLLHELMLRRGQRSFPEARRIERVTSVEAAKVGINSTLDSVELQAAIEKSAMTCRELVATLVGNLWQWPAGV